MKKVNESLLKELLWEFCIERLPSRDIPKNLAHDVNMFEAGIIDSIDALELLICFEDDLGVIVPEELQDVSDLGSINGLCRFVLENVDPEILEDKLGAKIIID